MRGEDRRTERLFSYVNLEARVPPKHPLRTILALANEALRSLSREFDAIYAQGGRPSIPPERLLRALLLQAFYSIRSERQLMEQLNYNMLYRWFVGLSVDDAVWDVTVFTKNRDRLLEGNVAKEFLAALLAQPKVASLLSSEHFSVDGTILEACASMKSFVPKDAAAETTAAPDTAADAGSADLTPDAPTVSASEAADCELGSAPADPEADPAEPRSGDNPAPKKRGRNAERDFHGEKRTNQTHASKTDPDARLFRKGKGKEAKLSHMGHVLMENRNGLVVGAVVTMATGTAEREATVAMLDQMSKNPPTRTLGADKAYDVKAFIAELCRRKVIPHIARNTTNRSSAVPDDVAATPGYAMSIRIRKRIEEVFGWMKTVGGQRKLRHRGTALVQWLFTLSAAAYNLVRLSRLLPVAA